MSLKKVLVLLFVLIICGQGFCFWGNDDIKIYIPENATYIEKLAAKEVRKYVYLRTDDLLEIETFTPYFRKEKAIVISRYGYNIPTGKSIPGIKDQSYRMYSIGDDKNRSIYIEGFGTGTLYGAYSFIEELGVRFYLHGDVLPDEKIDLKLPKLSINEIPKYGIANIPNFKLRGLLPFHDFPEGPDWWTVDEYKQVVEQMAKMKMNFLGMHCYPAPSLGPEPTVWIGLSEDINPDGTVEYGNFTNWHMTGRYAGYGLYWPMNTSEFKYGASQLFEEDAHGFELTKQYNPFPKTQEGATDVFNTVGDFLDELFSYGKKTGIKSCIGTETPLYVPPPVRGHLEAKEMNPDDPNVVKELYKGMFDRIQKTHPLDYYWLWTNENWTWHVVKQDVVDKTISDMKIALGALEEVGEPFNLATCGWLMGHVADRTLFERHLPEKVAFSCINRSAGSEFVDPTFAKIECRDKWAIPWFEDDSAMCSPQLWAGRMKKDAQDAYNYGCNGLMGLHWRTRVLSPNISILSKLAWDEDIRKGEKDKNLNIYGAIGGSSRRFEAEIEGTDEDELYQTGRYGLKRYNLKVPKGTYDVTLKFAELQAAQEDRRSFGIEINGKKVAKYLDLWKEAGKNTAYDLTFEDIRVENERLEIRFLNYRGAVVVNGIVVDGMTDAFNQFAAKPFTLKINCGGGEYKDYQADLEAIPVKRFLPVDDFWADWCKTQFGESVAEETAKIFERMDCNMPRPSSWNRGPGPITANKTPWEQEKKAYGFVTEFAALKENVKGAGNQERFNWWMNRFKYTRELARVGCLSGKMDVLMAKLDEYETDMEKTNYIKAEVLPVRVKLENALEQMYSYLFATVNNSTELGTIANIEQQSLYRLGLVDKYDDQIEKKLSIKWPDRVPLEGHYSYEYKGEPRLIVPAKRGRLEDGEDLELKIQVLSENRPEDISMYCKELGDKEFDKISAEHVSRGVYEVMVPTEKISGDLEYYVEGIFEDKKLRFPVTSPNMNHVVVVIK